MAPKGAGAPSEHANNNQGGGKRRFTINHSYVIRADCIPKILCLPVALPQSNSTAG